MKPMLCTYNSGRSIGLVVDIQRNDDEEEVYAIVLCKNDMSIGSMFINNIKIIEEYPGQYFPANTQSNDTNANANAQPQRAHYATAEAPEFTPLF